MTSELRLKQDVLDELEFEPSVNAAHIGVSVNRGVVTLTGFVGSYAEKIAAERTVRRVKGVIAEEIEVRLPSDTKRSDDQIAARALDILKWQVGMPAARIGVTVEKGVVTLTGDVGWQFQRRKVEQAVHKITGVIGIVNQIRVATPAHVPEVREKIERALQRNAALAAAAVTVKTEGGKVVLSGKVHAWYERDIAEHAAWSASEVTEVQDLIIVEPSWRDVE